MLEYININDARSHERKGFLVVLYIWACLTSCIVVLYSLNIPEPVFTVINSHCTDKKIPHGQGNKVQSTTHAFRSYLTENRFTSIMTISQ